MINFRFLFKSAFSRLTGVICAFFAFASLAQAQMQDPFDYTTSAKLNGIELLGQERFFSYEEAQTLFGNDGKITGAVFSECTSNFDLDISYPEKNIRVRLEYFPEHNPDFDKAEKFSLENPNVANLPSKASLWVDWDDMQFLTQTLQIGSLTVTPDLTFETFKQHFPESAKSDISAENEPPTYVVYLASPEYIKEFEGNIQQLFDGPAYSMNVQLTFYEGKLYKISLWQGIAC